ncbi:MAG: single-stranded-DNA-specific exonuclease RecJ [Clostridia bacterium]|nr:single-stranded-DNA-specific exonuclease RecJ [Clostridia bacterium]
MKKIDDRLYKFLSKKGISNADMQDFLFPNISKMLNPFDLNGMSEAVEKIKLAIGQNKKILVFGDYDCDGVSAATILVLYLKEKGANVDAFIPNRFDDGYGLTSDTIKEFCESGKPDLVVTVDLGITAIDEVEELNKLGIDVIVTDHHEPGETLPNCTVIDAKVIGQKYQFNGLCGAGVALKLVEAIEGRDFIKKYLDICAIATIGDIVPLVSENRIIAKLGLEKINTGNAMPSIKFLLDKLGLKTISSEDVSFRIVPRLNSSGRMDNGKKVLDFLVETDPAKLEELYAKIDADNELRLKEINSGNEKIIEAIKNIDIEKNNVILAVGEFHQGVLGILASRVCHDFNRPAIIFTKTQEGTYKGSGRSVGNIDIHSKLAELSDLFVRFGGHKMAVGVEIVPENFEEFKTKFNSLMESDIKDYEKQLSSSRNYDIEITEDDINLNFINQVKLLEPFGCENEKPVFMLKANSVTPEQMKGKNFKHFKLHLKNNKQIIAFAAYKYVELLKSNCTKNLFVDLEINTFGGKKSPSAKLVGAEFADSTFEFDNELKQASGILNRYLSIKNQNQNLKCYHLSEQKLIEKAEELSSASFGTMIICQSKKALTKMLANTTIKNSYIVTATVPSNKKNCILIKSAGKQTAEIGYTNYLFFTSTIRNEHYLFDSSKTVYDLNLFDSSSIVSTDRELMGTCYKTIKKCSANIYANDMFDLAQKLSYYAGGISMSQILFAICVFDELNIISVSNYEQPTITINENNKNELTNSKLYREFVRIPN